MSMEAHSPSFNQPLSLDRCPDTAKSPNDLINPNCALEPNQMINPNAALEPNQMINLDQRIRL
ncbi:MAG: hypothetical protein LBE80_08815, partial [Deltaproteobacteria bacterium]|nr:hypothetical protein [Deltaproteobacteria bacterium]